MISTQDVLHKTSEKNTEITSFYSGAQKQVPQEDNHSGNRHRCQVRESRTWHCGKVHCMVYMNIKFSTFDKTMLII